MFSLTHCLFSCVGVQWEFGCPIHKPQGTGPCYHGISCEYSHTPPPSPLSHHMQSCLSQTLVMLSSFWLQGCKEIHDPFKNNTAPWSAFRSIDYGYTRMNVMNATHLYVEQVSDDKVSFFFWEICIKYIYILCLPFQLAKIDTMYCLENHPFMV